MIKVSIIVPVYNVEKYLKQCIESIINQSLKEIEIICVNDGSTDSSGEILEFYERQDSRIRVIHKSNSGYGHTVNIGMGQAKGEYIGIVESDDYICEDMYEYLYEQAKQFELDIIKADYMRVYTTKDSKTYEYSTNITIKKEDYNRVIDTLQEDVNMYIPFASWSGIYKKAFIEINKIRHNETPGASYQDVGFCTLTTLLAKRMMYLPKACYRYRIDNPNASVKSKEKVNCVFEEYAYIDERLKQNPQLYNRYKENLVDRCLLNYYYTARRIEDVLLDDLMEYVQTYIQRMKKEGRYTEQWLDKRQKKLFEEIELKGRVVSNDIVQHKVKYRAYLDKFQRMLEDTNKIVLYGAGAVGKGAFEILIELHEAHKIAYYAVTHKTEEQCVGSIKIKEIDEIQDKDSFVIIAVSPTKSMKQADEMYERALKLGFKYIVRYDEILSKVI